MAFEKLPRFGTDRVNESEPSEAKKNSGWASNGVASSAEFNWLHRTTHDALEELARRAVRQPLAAATVQTPAASYAGTFLCASYAEGLFVIGGTSNGLQTSPDGVNWTQRTSGLGAVDIRGIAYSESQSRFVIVGGHTTDVSVSNDGATWSASTALGAASPNGWNDVAYSPTLDLWVAVGDSGQLDTATDPTGAWTSIGSGSGNNLNAVSWANGIFMAVGDSGDVFTSTDGTTWVQQTFVDTLADRVGVLYYDRLGVWIAQSDTPYAEISSDNGVTWSITTNFETALGSPFRGIFELDSFIVSVGDSETMETSRDADTWRAVIFNTASSIDIYAVASSPTHYLFVGGAGGDIYLSQGF